MSNGLPTEQWHEIKCNPFVVGSRSRQKCFSWCELLARCFGVNKNKEWIGVCSKKFRELSRNKMTIPNVNVSIEVVPCKPFTNDLFFIKALTGKMSVMLTVFVKQR